MNTRNGTHGINFMISNTNSDGPLINDEERLGDMPQSKELPSGHESIREYEQAVDEVLIEKSRIL